MFKAIPKMNINTFLFFTILNMNSLTQFKNGFLM